jgi:acyl dehydratase
VTPISSTHVFTSEDTHAYAAATEDWNPIHLDDAAARQAGLEGAVVHGMLPVALAIELLRRGQRRRVDLIGVRFRRPVPVGGEILVELDVSNADATFSVSYEGEVVTEGQLRLRD